MFSSDKLPNAPDMERVFDNMVDAVLAVLNQPETARKMAAYVREYYEALVARGFSEDQATRIVAAHPLPFPFGK